MRSQRTPGKNWLQVSLLPSFVPSASTHPSATAQHALFWGHGDGQRRRHTQPSGHIHNDDPNRLLQTQEASTSVPLSEPHSSSVGWHWRVMRTGGKNTRHQRHITQFYCSFSSVFLSRRQEGVWGLCYLNNHSGSGCQVFLTFPGADHGGFISPGWKRSRGRRWWTAKNPKKQKTRLSVSLWRGLRHGASEGSGTENPEPDRLDLNEEGISELEDKSKGLL